MNEQKIAQALNTISLGVAELAEALTEQPGAVVTPPTKASSPLAAASQGSSPPADTFSDGTPIEEWPDFRSEVAAKIDATPARVIRGMGDVCPDHELAWEVVPGGVSKRTGKPYKAFWHCPSFSCKQKPEKDWQNSHPAGRAA